MQRLQTIVATNDAPPILKALPLDLHPFIYKFIAVDVKLHYWMDKYNWTDTLHDLDEYYCGLYIVSTCFRHLEQGDITEQSFLRNANAYIEKDKYRDAQGRVVRVEFVWNDEHCDYDEIYDQLGSMICKQYEERRDMNGLYKLLSQLITLWDDTDNLWDDTDNL